ncbi:MAG: ribosome maturation factor RimM [Thermoanaerobaculia bacterium]
MSSRSSKKTTSEPSARSAGETTVEVGRVLRPHGVRGEAVVDSYSDVPERFAAGAELLVLPEAGRPRRRLTVEAARPHRGRLLVRFEGLAGREDVEDLRGALLQVPGEDVPAPPEGTWYHFQLVGCRCVDRRRGPLGEVTDVREDGGGDLLEVRLEGTPEGGRLLVPFVGEVVRAVQPEAGRIEVDLPEGLLEACASRS